MDVANERAWPARGRKGGGKRKKGGKAAAASLDNSAVTDNLADASGAAADVVDLDDTSLVDVVGGGNTTTGGSLNGDSSTLGGSDIVLDVGQHEAPVPDGADDSEARDSTEGQGVANPKDPASTATNASAQGDEEEEQEVVPGVSSFHSQVTSPIGSRRQVLEQSFLDVSGDDSLRGDGTPPENAADPAFSFSNGASSAHKPHAGAAETAEEAAQQLLSGFSKADLEAAVPSRPPHSERQVSRTSSGGSSRRTDRADATTRDQRRRHQALRQRVWLATVVSLLSNVALFSFKIYISITSRSLAVMASAIDSFLDLVSQAIIYFALRGTREVDEEKYPVGRNRLEPIGIIVCASLMGIAGLQLIWESARTIIRGTIAGEDTAALVPAVDADTVTLLASAIVIKLVLFLLCNSMREESDSMMVLAEDHRNDVLSNGVALVTAYVAHRFVRFWWLDPVGGISISLYICVMWLLVAQEQAAMLEGVAAEPKFLEEVKVLANTFHEKMYVDVVRAYHFGKRYLVEVEVVLPGNMIVVDAHDISLELQKSIERLERVERAFVHVDYKTRDENEHKAAHYITPQTTPRGGDESDEDAASRSSSVDLDEEIEVLGDIYGKAVPPGRVLHKHVHMTHHRHHGRSGSGSRRSRTHSHGRQGNAMDRLLQAQLASNDAVKSATYGTLDGV